VVRSEIQYQVRRLARHPSVVVWNACNECLYDNGSETSTTNGQTNTKGHEQIRKYIDFAMTTVAQTDPSRAIWPTSPSKGGWASGVDRA
ncbi:unnamed protein product, partial [Amoebophrya sp. A25]